MAGQPGRSGGHNRKTPAELALAGTHRRDRHGGPASNVLPMPVAPGEWAPSDTDRAELGPRGQAALAEWLAHFAFSPAEGALVLELARLEDRLASIRRVLGAPALEDRLAWLRLELQVVRTKAGLVAALKVPKG